MDAAFDLPAAFEAFNAPIPGVAGAPPFRVAVHDRHPRLAEVRFADDGVIEIAMAARYPPWTSAGFLMSRMAGARAVFALLRQMHPDLRGECDLWLADVPDRPGLAFSGALASSLLIPDADFQASNGYAAFRAELAGSARPWRERIDRAFWRGTFSGDPFRQLPSWRSVQRARVCLELGTPEMAGDFDVGFSAATAGLTAEEQAAVHEEGLVRGPVPLMRFADFRMSLDVDGNSSAWSGLFTKLLMGGTVLKVDSPAGARQWYYPRLIPWVHFIPVRADLSDTADMVAWVRQNEAAAQEIAERGKALVEGFTLRGEVEALAPALIAHIRARKAKRPGIGRPVPLR